MSYQLSGADRDAIEGFVDSEQVEEAVTYVEKLIQRELEAASAASGVQKGTVKNTK